jgi:hypothetical protein
MLISMAPKSVLFADYCEPSNTKLHPKTSFDVI